LNYRCTACDMFATDAIRSGLPPHVAAKICGHSTVDTTMGYAAIYPEDVIAHHRAFIARRRAERPSEEYRDLTNREWDDFLAHFELRKVALGTCGRDHGTPCAHENACVRCPLLRVDPAQMPRLKGIHANLVGRLREAKEQGWLGEVAAIETTIAAAEQKLAVMSGDAVRRGAVQLGMPDIRRSIGRSSWRPCRSWSHREAHAEWCTTEMMSIKHRWACPIRARPAAATVTRPADGRP
jgi:hypothetical protein